MASVPIHPSKTFVDTSRYECFDGHVVERPLPNQAHAKIQYAIVTLLRPQVRGIDHTVLQEWTLDRNENVDHEWMTPDVLVSKSGEPLSLAGHALPPALLAVEILSAGQTYSEMRKKAFSYFRWGVGCVWIIDPASHSAMVLDGQEANEEGMLFEGELVANGLSLGLDDIFSFE